MALVPPWNESKLAVVNSPGPSQLHGSFELDDTSNPKIFIPGHQGPHNVPLFQVMTTPQFSSNPRWPASSLGVRQTEPSLETRNTSMPSQQSVKNSLKSEQGRKWHSPEVSTFKSVATGNKQFPLKEATMILPSHRSPQAIPMNPGLTNVNQCGQQGSLIAPLSSLSLKVNLVSPYKLKHVKWYLASDIIRNKKCGR